MLTDIILNTIFTFIISITCTLKEYPLSKEKNKNELSYLFLCMVK